MNENRIYTFVMLCEDTIQQILLLQHYFNQLETENEECILQCIQVLINTEVHVRVDNYYEHWLPRYLDTDFFGLFRMTKNTFSVLLTKLQIEERVYGGGGFPVSGELQLLMTLWWLGKGEVLLSVSDKFNVAISTVYSCTKFILSKLIGLMNSYIVWPDSGEATTIENDFFERCGYPGVIGAIDGCCIEFKPPKDQQDSYIDRSRNHSVKLQAVVTCNKIFTNVMIGFPGSVHDSRVFRNSRLYIDITQDDGNVGRYFYDNKHLVGDSAYPLLKWLMTPYRDNGNLTNRQRRHNTFHSKTRVPVEHTFGILKCRWRILKYINVNSVERAIDIIAACCLLHNFCYVEHDFWDDYVPEVYEEEENNNDPNGLEAVNKRDEITRSLFL